MSMSLRAWPVGFPDDIAVLRRVPYEARADSVTYRQVLAESARARGWDVHLYDARDVESLAASVLGRRAGEVLRGPRATLGPPWGKDQRMALAATIMAGRERSGSLPTRCLDSPRAAMARAFVAKAVYDMPTTRVLLDRLDTDAALRRLCGWEKKSAVPSESVFSRAFVEFADTQLPQRVHEALIGNTHHDRLVGHLSRDSTAIEAREKPATTDKAPPPPKRKRGRPRKGEERPKVLKRLNRQEAMSLQAMLDELPTGCDVGTKKNSKGYKATWVGYKLHLDVADGQIPISCLLTSASLHDSQAAIPLATISAGRTTNLYDLMDAAYDAESIRRHSRSLGHVPLIDVNPRGDKRLAEELRTESRRLERIGFQLPEQVRYNERTAGERVNGRLKDEFGGRHVRVRGASKVMCHCMFGVLALTADQLVRLVT